MEQTSVNQGNSEDQLAILGPTGRWSSQTLRELIAAVLSLAIAAVALWLLADTYLTGREVAPVNDTHQQKLHEDAYVRQTDLLLYALAWLGTVTGYYLGRVPAELHA